MSHEQDQLHALVRFRIGQAHETLREARILQENVAWRGTQNRAYYAMFYALLALLSTRRLSTSKHSGAISLFDREFVKPGIVGREFSRILHSGFSHRQSYDYGDLIDVDETAAAQSVEEARRFISRIEQLLISEGYLASGQAGEH